MASKPKAKVVAHKARPVTATQVEAVLTRARVQVQAKRELLGLSRPQLADLVDRTSSTITKLERGERDGSISAWLKVSIALDLSMAQLFATNPDATPVGVRDRKLGYGSDRSSASEGQLAALMDAARKLDADDVLQLIQFARRIGRDKP